MLRSLAGSARCQRAACRSTSPTWSRCCSAAWNQGGCASWYLNAAGRNPTLWPGSVGRFRRATRRVDLAEYNVIRAGAR